ncbi:MAG TPA: glycosyltransferase family 39 protein, partial [Candidatus Saccharimonadales bacterium]|nr:glycosyltransferase family 39 protein [Candidatus Saccharimonadales bacterium]
MKNVQKYKALILGILLLTGASLRFYNLNWGAPFYFHPDERNITDLVLKTSLSNPQSLLKGTFAYGNFPVILTIFLKPLFLPFFRLLQVTDPFAQAIIILRFISAIFSTLTLYIIYLCGKFWSKKTAYLSLFFATFSAGLIQQAHFGTYDGSAAFCSITVFYFLLKFLKTKKARFYYLSIIFIAIGVSAKINLLILAIFPAILLLTRLKKQKKALLYIFMHAILGIILLLALAITLSPYYITPEFKSSLTYEQSLVTGTIPVFYTQSFFGTVPVLFQFQHILPFLINPILTIIFIPSFFLVLYKSLKTQKQQYLILNTFYLILFLPQAFFFAKWTRYMVPALPFIYLIIAIALHDVIARSEATKQSLDLPAGRQGLPRSFQSLAMTILIFVNILFGVSYFITAFTRSDTRIEAANFAKNNIPQNAEILSEPYDLGLTPFNSVSSNITIFNFYELDNNSPEFTDQKLTASLQKSDYIILPSQRLLRSRLLSSKQFPKGHGFYSLLINEAA